jgi:Inner membrane component of T3SS, cytoplasmic domain
MTDQVQTILLYTCLIFGFLLFWAASIGFTFWDASKRKLSTGELVGWVALAALMPLIGAAAYLFSRILSVLFSPGGPDSTPSHKRFTLFKRAQQPEVHTDTLLASDLLQDTYAAAQPAHPGTADDNSPRVSSAARGAREARLHLKVIDGPHAGQEYHILSLPAQIGRVPEAAVRLDQDLGVSRHHAEIYERAGELRIRDLSSAHGTLLGGSKIDDRGLLPGDHIQVGLTTLEVREGEGRK